METMTGEWISIPRDSVYAEVKIQFSCKHERTVMLTSAELGGPIWCGRCTAWRRAIRLLPLPELEW